MRLADVPQAMEADVKRGLPGPVVLAACFFSGTRLFREFVSCQETGGGIPRRRNPASCPVPRCRKMLPTRQKPVAQAKALQ